MISIPGPYRHVMALKYIIIHLVPFANRCRVFNIKAEIALLVVSWFSGPLRQYFSLYQVVSQRKGERRGKKTEEHKNVPTAPHPHLLQAQ